MASPITSTTGLGSGLNIGDIVKVLVTAQTQAKTDQISKTTTAISTKISAAATLKSALTTFQTSLTNLGDVTKGAFNAYAATSSNTSTLTATASNTAVAGTFKIHVNSLATASKVGTAAFSGGATSAIPSGNLTVTQNGISTSFTVGANATLQSVRDQINAKSNTSGISANVVTDSNGSRLVFSGVDVKTGNPVTGAGSDITTSSDIAGFTITAGSTLDPTSASSAGIIGAAATDASLTVDGLPITSKSNTIDKAIGGLSFNLLSAGTQTTDSHGVSTFSGADSTITVASNTSGLQTSLQSFVDSYNALVKTINSLTTATTDPTTGQLTVAAPYTGDSMPRNLLSDLRQQLVSPGPGSALSVLSQLGVNTAQGDGTLSIDSTKFTAAMSKNLGGQIQQLFSDTTSGLSKRMTSVLTPYTQTGGILDTRTTQLNKQQDDVDKQKAQLDLLTTNLTSSLTAKYNAMDLVVGQLKATNTSITSFFSSLNAQQSSS
ncbi:flagellar filament capping protein FliD [Pseudomonas sp. Pseusp122]|uniref:flagellar filament capping protein FliD n=1 Tax=unclassified Pseudomonas TaxID=196821 RepID=UPI0039A6500D